MRGILWKSIDKIRHYGLLFFIFTMVGLFWLAAPSSSGVGLSWSNRVSALRGALIDDSSFFHSLPFRHGMVSAPTLLLGRRRGVNIYENCHSFMHRRSSAYCGAWVGMEKSTAAFHGSRAKVFFSPEWVEGIKITTSENIFDAFLSFLARLLATQQDEQDGWKGLKRGCSSALLSEAFSSQRC